MTPECSGDIGDACQAEQVERSVETAPRTSAAGCQAQVGGRFTYGRGQGAIERLEQYIASTPKEHVHVMTDGSEPCAFWCVAIQKDGYSSLSV
jgi:hypothetical protein